MSPGLGFFRAKCRSKAIDLSECGRCSFAVELPGLRKVGGAFVEVFGREESTALANCSSEDRCINQKKVTIVKEIANTLLDFVANRGDCTLAIAPQPQITFVE